MKPGLKLRGDRIKQAIGLLKIIEASDGIMDIFKEKYGFKTTYVDSVMNPVRKINIRAKSTLEDMIADWWVFPGRKKVVKDCGLR